MKRNNNDTQYHLTDTYNEKALLHLFSTVFDMYGSKTRKQYYIESNPIMDGTAECSKV